MKNDIGTAELKCGKCSNIIFVDNIDINFELIETTERGMGEEYQWNGRLELGCPKCDQDIVLIADVWEYPIDFINHEEVTALNAKIITSNIAVNVDYSDEMYHLAEDKESRRLLGNIESGIQRLILDIGTNWDLVYKIEPREFEKIIAEIFSSKGFLIELTKQTRDGGRDIIALKSDLGINQKFIIECKRYRRDRNISVSVVRGLYGTALSEGVNKAILVTTSGFSADSQRFSQKNETKWMLDLKDYQDVKRWIGEYRRK